MEAPACVGAFSLPFTGGRAIRRRMNSYFKKFDPKIGVVLSDGSKVIFTAVTREVGIFATELDKLAGELDACIAKGRGSIERISHDQFKELLEKKTPGDPLKKSWREEWSNSSHAFNQPGTIALPVAAVDPTTPVANEPAPIPVNTVRPTASKR